MSGLFYSANGMDVKTGEAFLDTLDSFHELITLIENGLKQPSWVIDETNSALKAKITKLLDEAVTTFKETAHSRDAS